jgi:hypothetical protein
MSGRQPKPLHPSLYHPLPLLVTKGHYPHMSPWTPSSSLSGTWSGRMQQLTATAHPGAPQSESQLLSLRKSLRRHRTLRAAELPWLMLRQLWATSPSQVFQPGLCLASPTCHREGQFTGCTAHLVGGHTAVDAGGGQGKIGENELARYLI